MTSPSIFLNDNLHFFLLLPKRRMKKIGTLHNNFFEKMAIFLGKWQFLFQKFNLIFNVIFFVYGFI
jgi:uncharacterized membrane protein